MGSVGSVDRDHQRALQLEGAGEDGADGEEGRARGGRGMEPLLRDRRVRNLSEPSAGQTLRLIPSQIQPDPAKF